MANQVPAPQQLELAQFPRETWARALVSAFNQLAQQVVQALTVAAPVYKTLVIGTGADPTTSFPIDFPVAAAPIEVRVAMVLSGVPSGAVTVVATPLSGGKLLRVSSITGLSANSTYSIRLALS